MIDSFVYEWTNIVNSRKYIGIHKGTVTDGYICSGKTMLEDYRQEPHNFVRVILFEGTYKECQSLEQELLKKVDAARNMMYYNRTNGLPHFYTISHTEKTRKKMSISKIGNKNSLGKKLSAETKLKMSAAKKGCIPWNVGKSPSDETRQKLKLARAKQICRPHTEETKRKISQTKMKATF